MSRLKNLKYIQLNHKNTGEKMKYLIALFFIMILSSYSHASNTTAPLTKNKGTIKIQPNKAFSVFIVKNIDNAKNFYINNFNFNIAFENEWYLHLVSKTGIQVAFMLPNQPTQPNIFHPQHIGSGIIFSLEVNDADFAYKYARDNSLDIVLKLKSEEWGQRHFAIKDPNGIYIDIVQTIKPSTKYQENYNEK